MAMQPSDTKRTYIVLAALADDFVIAFLQIGRRWTNFAADSLMNVQRSYSHYNVARLNATCYLGCQRGIVGSLGYLVHVTSPDLAGQNIVLTTL